MLYRRLGQTDLNLSVIGFGCWPVGNDWTSSNDQKSISVIQRAIDLGINFFDVAPIYGFNHAEVVLGKAIAGKRDKVYVGGKCGLRWNESRTRVWRDLSKRSILQEIEETLQRLGTDYIDLMQIHWPDVNTPLDETYSALQQAKDEGKIRHIGVSNFNVLLLEQIEQYGPVASNQVLYNAIDRNSDRYHELPLCYRTEQEILPYCQENQIGIIPYSPLCQGLLADKFDVKKIAAHDVRLTNPQLIGTRLASNLEFVNRMKIIARKYQRPLVQLALNWLRQNEAITSIIAAPTRVEELEENVACLEWDIEQQDLETI